MSSSPVILRHMSFVKVSSRRQTVPYTSEIFNTHTKVYWTKVSPWVVLIGEILEQPWINVRPNTDKSVSIIFRIKLLTLKLVKKKST